MPDFRGVWLQMEIPKHSEMITLYHALFWLQHFLMPTAASGALPQFVT